ncbi:MAG: hypothetical protein ABIG88_03045 [Patescibacteria group bacterium]|nr:hypothetical protein [Patescibacteria group bacterium]
MLEIFKKKYGVGRIIGSWEEIRTRIFSQKASRKITVIVVGLDMKTAIRHATDDKNMVIFKYRGTPPVIGENTSVCIKFPV